MFTKFGHAV